jgi:hypothetical protein
MNRKLRVLRFRECMLLNFDAVFLQVLVVLPPMRRAISSTRHLQSARDRWYAGDTLQLLRDGRKERQGPALIATVIGISSALTRALSRYRF